jgi:hypothetical protein
MLLSQMERGRSRLLRRSAAVLILLALGAVVSLGTTWALVLLDPTKQPEGSVLALSGPGGKTYLASLAHAFGRDLWTVTCAERTPYTFPQAPGWLPLPGEREYFSISEGWGWPARCMMQHGYLWQNNGWMADAADSFTWQRGLKTYQFPTRILWWGMLLNTLIWSAAAFVVWRLVRAARRRLRARAWRRRGLCRGCGYDLRGLGPGGVCPECGRISAPKPVAPGGALAAS